MHNFEISSQFEHREGEKERPNLTVYLMRHGETETDKSKPNRGLTEHGQEQVRENFNGIIDQLIQEEVPEFRDFDDPEKRKAAAVQAFSKVEMHLAESGTDRTQEQVWLERGILIDMGVPPEDLHLPKSTYEWAVKNGKIEAMPEDGGPGVKRRLAGVGGMDSAKEFRKKISNPEYQAQIGATDEIIAWAKTPDDEIPEGVETRNQMEARLQSDLGKVEHVASKRLNGRPKRTVYVANSHASILTLAASSELNAPIEQVGEIENGEGLRLDFYGEGKAHTAQPFGKNTEAKFQRLREQPSA